MRTTCPGNRSDDNANNPKRDAQSPGIGSSVPQFRVLIYLNRHEGASLSDVADHLGLTLPATSKMVGGLVDRDLVSRQTHAGDRRYVILAPTERGRTLMRAAYETTQSRLAERLSALPEPEQTLVVRAMSVLETIFARDPKAETGSGDMTA